MTEILLINEVAERLRVSTSTVNRWLGESRKGIGNFPQPISAFGGKLRWTRDSIEAYIASLESVAMPTPARTKRRNAKAHAERQANVDRALAKYRTKGDA